MPISPPLPHARHEPPWSCNGDPAAADFGTLYAYPAHVGWSLYYDRRQHRFAFSTSADLPPEVAHGGRRWNVVRLTAADERELRAREADEWSGRALAEARARAAKSLQQREVEQLEAFQHGTVLAAIDQALAALQLAQQRCAGANDLDARLNRDARDRLFELRAVMEQLARAHARLCAERDHAEAQEALAELEEDLAAGRAA